MSVYIIEFRKEAAMRFGISFVFISIVFILTACTSGPSQDEFAPKIGDIFTSVEHYHPSFYSKDSSEDQRTIGFVVSVSISDPDGLDDVTSVSIRDKKNGWTLPLIKSNSLTLVGQCAKGEDVYMRRLYSNDRPDLMDLKDYEIIAVDRHSYSSTKSFELKLPAGLEIENEEFVYSSEFSGGTNNGIEALEAMTILNNEMLFSVDETSETLHVEFTPSDDRVTDFGLALFDGSEDPKYIGQVCYQESSLDSGVKKSADIPFAQIEFESGFDTSDINGLHVILFDASTVWTQPKVEDKWFNYLGFSEFITVEP